MIEKWRNPVCTCLCLSNW